jgi:hypothetical protein
MRRTVPTHHMADDQDARKPGRPRGQEPHTRLTAWVPSAHYDHLITLAKRRNQSLSGLVASVLRHVVHRDEGGAE